MHGGAILTDNVVWLLVLWPLGSWFGTLGSPVSSLGAGFLKSLLVIWAPVWDGRLGKYSWGSELSRGPVGHQFQDKSTQELSCQDRVSDFSVAPAGHGSCPSSCLESDLVKPSTITSQGPERTAR